jgi:hypothetical protein
MSLLFSLVAWHIEGVALDQEKKHVFPFLFRSQGGMEVQVGISGVWGGTDE